MGRPDDSSTCSRSATRSPRRPSPDFARRANCSTYRHPATRQIRSLAGSLTDDVVSAALDQADAISRSCTAPNSHSTTDRRTAIAQQRVLAGELCPNDVRRAWDPRTACPLAYFPRDVLGVAMGALHGGESFVGIRAVPDQPVPVRACDFGGIYPIMAALTGAFELLAALNHHRCPRRSRRGRTSAPHRRRPDPPVDDDEYPWPIADRARGVAPVGTHVRSRPSRR